MLEINGLYKATIRRPSKDSQPSRLDGHKRAYFALTQRSGFTRNSFNFKHLGDSYPVLEVGLFFHLMNWPKTL